MLGSGFWEQAGKDWANFVRNALNKTATPKAGWAFLVQGRSNDVHVTIAAFIQPVLNALRRRTLNASTLLLQGKIFSRILH